MQFLLTELPGSELEMAKNPGFRSVRVLPYVALRFGEFITNTENLGSIRVPLSQEFGSMLVLRFNGFYCATLCIKRVTVRRTRVLY